MTSVPRYAATVLTDASNSCFYNRGVTDILVNGRFRAAATDHAHMDDICVVNIISTAYSGSTWLNLVLGSHPGTFSVGEFKLVRRPGRSDCTIHGPPCPVFSQFDAQSSENPFVQLHRITGKSIFIVNNSRKFLPAQTDSQIKAKFIHLVRDGRAVTASSLRKGVRPNMWRAATRWVHEIRRDRRLIRRQPEPHRCTLQYEKAVARPFEQLQHLCQLIGVEPDSDMLQYWNHQHHFIGGNKGTLTAMLKKRYGEASMPKPPASSATGRAENLEYYKQSDPETFVDQRWSHELTKQQLRIFALIAGRWNRKFGYR